VTHSASYVTLTSIEPAEIPNVTCDFLSPATVRARPLLSSITVHYPGGTFDVTVMTEYACHEFWKLLKYGLQL
jgi:hypothetical protein